MIEFLSQKILSYLLLKETVDSNDHYQVEFYRYGIEITLSSVCNILLILLLSLLLGDIVNGLVFLAIFIPTRQYTGGYHADTYWRCNMAFGIVYVITDVLSRQVFESLPLWLAIVLLAVELFAVALYCPIAHRNKPLDNPEQRQRYKRIALFLYAAFGGFGLYLLHERYVYGTTILFTLHAIAVLGILGFWKERREHS